MAVGRVPVTEYRRHRFATHYTRADAELLAQVDEAHGTLAGPATRRILEHEYRIFGKAEFERLSAISVAHLYNLRKNSRYRQRLRTYNRTRPATVSIGERRHERSQRRERAGAEGQSSEFENRPELPKRA